jgi:hypothetical protein
MERIDPSTDFSDGIEYAEGQYIKRDADERT